MVIDIDALGGPNNVSCLHLASQNCYYDIVDVLVENKAELFNRDINGYTPLSGITNNLLMIKLLKKE